MDLCVAPGFKKEIIIVLSIHKIQIKHMNDISYRLVPDLKGKIRITTVNLSSLINIQIIFEN